MRLLRALCVLTLLSVSRAEEAKLYLQLTRPGSVRCVAMSPDGRLVVTSNFLDNTARLWEAATGREIRKFEASDTVVAAAFSPNGRYLVTGNYDTGASC